ncbi:MAG: FAD-dependent oxidoreductase [Symbiobacteriaceae bacterium]
MAEPRMQTEASLVAELNDLLQLDHDAVQAYGIAIEAVEDERLRETLIAFRGDHERHIDELTELIRAHGGIPIETAHIPTGMFKAAVQRAGAARGDRALMLAFKANERQVRDKYRRHADAPHPPEVRAVLARAAADEEQRAAVRTPWGEVRAGTFVLAGGVSNAALSARLGVALPVIPVKGQVLAVQPPPDLRGFLDGQVPVFGNGVYLVPRLDGRLLVGATEEPEAGYDRSATLGAITRLAAAAQRLVPALERARWLGAQTGLRPGTPDRRPLLGPLPRYPNVIAAAGHYRNGILLAPLTARIVAGLCAGREPEFDLGPLDPGRFVTAPGSDHSMPGPCPGAGKGTAGSEGADTVRKHQWRS